MTRRRERRRRILNDRGHQGRDGRHLFACLGGDLELGEVKVGREAGGWRVDGGEEGECRG